MEAAAAAAAVVRQLLTNSILIKRIFFGVPKKKNKKTKRLKFYEFVVIVTIIIVIVVIIIVPFNNGTTSASLFGWCVVQFLIVLSQIERCPRAEIMSSEKCVCVCVWLFAKVCGQKLLFQRSKQAMPDDDNNDSDSDDIISKHFFRSGCIFIFIYFWCANNVLIESSL